MCDPFLCPWIRPYKKLRFAPENERIQWVDLSLFRDSGKSGKKYRKLPVPLLWFIYDFVRKRKIGWNLWILKICFSRSWTEMIYLASIISIIKIVFSVDTVNRTLLRFYKMSRIFCNTISRVLNLNLCLFIYF